MRILLAIKEEFASKIFDGTKRFEFRKSIFKDDRVTTVVVYVSSPIKRVIGEFEIEAVLSDSPHRLWKLTKEHSGITKEFFDTYFADRDRAYAIKIKTVKKYKKSKCLVADFNIDFAPQSYLYLDERFG